jgi:hypothetical protein
MLAAYLPEPMIMWPISTRVNKPDNDDAAILEALAAAGTSLLQRLSRDGGAVFWRA